MKNFIWAFAISIIIHFLLLFSFNTIDIRLSKDSASKTISPQYTQVKLVQIKQPIKKKTPIKKEKIIKKKTYKKVVKKDIKIDKRKPSVFKRKLEKEISQKQEQKQIQQLDPLTQQYIKLYGKEYFSFSKETKKFLKENLNKIGQITQGYLRYPSIAVRTQQQGTNIVEFILKPSGDITNLKIIGSSHYGSLDRNTIKTIQIAFKDYPKPKEDTTIKIFVQYSLY